MGRRRQHRQEYSLDSGDLEQLSQKDIAAVIRAVDDLVGRGGRTMVGKILKGSASKDVLGLWYDKNPAYGHFRDLTLAKIGQRVD
ncbi:MAG: RQC domain-containing protein [Verrucomicrobiales bacterium]|jgi:hypothetical protein|nr:RQC domain-containing protein [Verrucomicrobiales bacterium]MDF1784540.1 RQC domain-containing protein [Verrucomicrobiales bacterium]